LRKEKLQLRATRARVSYKKAITRRCLNNLITSIQQKAKMSEQFHGWAVHEPKGQLSPWSYTPRPIGPRDVEIEITHCGICASGRENFLFNHCSIKHLDLHQIDSGWGPSQYPMVPGNV
jgi:hypothetical protein